VAPDLCSTSHGGIAGPGGKRLTCGAVASDAMGIAPPELVKLKEPKDFKIIGKATTRLDTAAKSTGQQKFSLDVDVTGMLVVLVARAPTWGGKIARLDNAEAAAMPGVSRIAKMAGDQGGDAVAVVADGYWQAKKVREALKIDWDFAGVERATTSQQVESCKALSKQPGTVAQRADTSALQSAPKVIEAVYEFPCLARTPMEPLNMTVLFDSGACKVWAGSQFQTVDRASIAAGLGLPLEMVEFKTLMAGGAFGRRVLPTAANAVEAPRVAKIVEGTPVKVMGSREDDVRGGYCRPMHVHRIKVGYDAHGNIAAWDHAIVGQSIAANSAFQGHQDLARASGGGASRIVVLLRCFERKGVRRSCGSAADTPRQVERRMPEGCHLSGFLRHGSPPPFRRTRRTAARQTPRGSRPARRPAGP
jgi:isoquinoline 1-oxidoreductase beta subunit